MAALTAAVLLRLSIDFQIDWKTVLRVFCCCCFCVLIFIFRYESFLFVVVVVFLVVFYSVIPTDKVRDGPYLGIPAEARSHFSSARNLFINEEESLCL